MENAPFQLGLLDLILGGLMLIFSVRGFVRGIVPELSGVLSILLALLAAGSRGLHSQAASWFKELLPDPGWADFSAYIAIFVLVFVILRMVFHMLERLFSEKAPNWIDRGFGGLAGVLKGLAICTVLLLCLSYMAPHSSFREKSFMAPYFADLWNVVNDISAGGYNLPDLAVPRR